MSSTPASDLTKLLRSCCSWNFLPPSICPTARLWCHEWAFSLAGPCSPAALERYNWTAGLKENVKLVVTHLWPPCYYIFFFFPSPATISIDLKFHEIRPKAKSMRARIWKMEKMIFYSHFFRILLILDSSKWMQNVDHVAKLHICKIFHWVKRLSTLQEKVDNL